MFELEGYFGPPWPKGLYLCLPPTEFDDDASVTFSLPESNRHESDGNVKSIDNSIESVHLKRKIVYDVADSDDDLGDHSALVNSDRVNGSYVFNENDLSADGNDSSSEVIVLDKAIPSHKEGVETMRNLERRTAGPGIRADLIELVSPVIDSSKTPWVAKKYNRLKPEKQLTIFESLAIAKLKK